MRYNEFLKESSSLNALGVDNVGVGNIHRQLKLKHDTEFEPIKNKAEAKKAINAGKVIIAVNGEGKAYGFGKWERPFSGTGTDVMFGMSDNPDGWGRIDSLTKALARVKGKGFKYYVSVEARQHMDKSDRRNTEKSPRDEGAPVQLFLDRFNKVYGNLIKDEANKGHKKVRKHLMKLLDKDTEGKTGWGGYTPSHKDMNKVKEYMGALKKMSKKGLDAWNTHARTGDRGEMGALGEFFPGTYYYMMNSAVGDFQENEKLALQKFAKFIRKEIANIVNLAKKGSYKEHPKNARHYKDDADNKEAARLARNEKQRERRAAAKKKK